MVRVGKLEADCHELLPQIFDAVARPRWQSPSVKDGDFRAGTRYPKMDLWAPPFVKCQRLPRGYIGHSTSDQMPNDTSCFVLLRQEKLQASDGVFVNNTIRDQITG